ncbi:hypothetical protein D1007_03355 [Hordeum vulgare]|nr:hypothetical protein D1007_03355 [Hordeum vulgare]
MALELLPLAPSATAADATGVWSMCSRALHLAATNGRTNVCRYLVQDLGIPVDTLSDERETPLLLAATFGHTATAAWLLERGASARAPDVDGETPLHWAAYNGTLHTHLAGRRHLALLRVHVAPVETPWPLPIAYGYAERVLDQTRARAGLTCWRVVRSAGDRDLAMLLLYKGADVGAANPRGTMLHVAAMRGCPEVVRVLLRHDADVRKDSCKRKAELKLEGNNAYTVKDYDTAILMYNLQSH